MSPSYRVDLTVVIEGEDEAHALRLAQKYCDWTCGEMLLITAEIADVLPPLSENQLGELARATAGTYDPILSAQSIGPLAEKIGTMPRLSRAEEGQILYGATFGDCESCDGYILSEAERPYCPTCARERREGKS